jgi:FkbM family methyltransferase
MRKTLKKIIIACFPWRIKLLLYSWFSYDLGMANDMFECIKNLKILGFNPDVVIDAGAYVGDWTTTVLKIFDRSKFLMIEPQSSKEAVLNRMVKLNNNILYKQTLLGETNKDNVQFFEMESGSSIYEEQTQVSRDIKHLSMTTINNLVADFKLTGKFFLKLDVQGAEVDVLEGASEIMNQIEFILVEVSLFGYNKGGPLFAEVVTYLNKKDFVLFDICNQYRKSDKTLFQVDLMFINRKSPIREKVDFKIPD